MQTDDVKKAFQKAGTDIVVSDPKEFGKFLKAELDKWGKVVKDLKLQVQ